MIAKNLLLHMYSDQMHSYYGTLNIIYCTEEVGVADIIYCWRDEIPREFTFVNNDVLYYKHQRNCRKWATVLDCCCRQLQLVTMATIVMTGYHSHWLHPLLLDTGCWSWSAMTSQFSVNVGLLEVMMVVAVNSHIWSNGDSSLVKGYTRCWLDRVSKRAWHYMEVLWLE